MDDPRPAPGRHHRQRAGAAAGQPRRLRGSHMGHGRHARGRRDPHDRQRAGGRHGVRLPHPADEQPRPHGRLPPAQGADADGSAGAASLRGERADPDQHHPELVHRGDRRRVQAGISQGWRDGVEQDQRRLRPSPQHDGPPRCVGRGGWPGLQHPVRLPAERPRQRRNEERRQALSLHTLRLLRHHLGADRGVRPGGAGHQPAGLGRAELRHPDLDAPPRATGTPATGWSATATPAGPWASCSVRP